ncbi:NADP-dependent oxidoreductase [Leisingera aquaemixtae]|uniref:NADP-dependent oxidoreductase n=1 Tax=Leisingera TaxID=191028 RepID=UPI001C984A09|nr:MULTISPECIES: NADP-dependent oxidoreductase [Leisingera]MBY6067115.1 NADP-dependent oxidoreductase [Leisingera aquaemixtae]MCB4455054.1 NADP-dependent oxidoreductase [Leisingera sp. McT4-56]
MPDQMQRIVLSSRPEGQASEENFRLETVDLPQPSEGEVVVKVHYMSLDPYMRGRMNAGKSYAPPVEIGETMTAGGVGEVIASNSPGFQPGDFALGMFGWASHACAKASELRKLDPDMAPLTTALGVLGMPGFTAWHGLDAYGRPQAGETLVVAAATGPVGSMVGQLAKQKGLRVVGIAGGADKCKLAVETFGFDACLDHRAYASAEALSKALAAECPDGIDIYYENVGGKVLEAVLPLMNNFGRIPVCGMIAWYNSAETDLTAPAIWRSVLTKFLSVNGFIIFNHYDRYGDFLRETAPRIASGDIKYLEDIAEGLENAPKTFLAMMHGGNTGKQIVKLV